MSEHLHPETIAQVASGRLRGVERAAAMAHAEGCEACRSDLTYLLGFERRRRRKRVTLLAGGLGIAALVVTMLPSGLPLAPGSSALVRSGGEGIARVQSYLPPNGSAVMGDTVTFAWQVMGPGTQYTFRLSTATGAPVLERAVRDTALYLPTSFPLEPGGAYLWLVDALMADGNAATSPVWRFTIPE